MQNILGTRAAARRQKLAADLSSLNYYAECHYVALGSKLECFSLANLCRLA